MEIWMSIGYLMDISWISSEIQWISNGMSTPPKKKAELNEAKLVATLPASKVQVQH